MRPFYFYCRYYHSQKTEFLKYVKPQEFENYRSNRIGAEIKLNLSDFKIDWDNISYRENRLLKRLFPDFLNSLYVEEVVYKIFSDISNQSLGVGKRLIVSLRNEANEKLSFKSLLTETSAWELAISIDDLSNKKNEYKYFLFDELLNRLEVEVSSETHNICPSIVVSSLDRHNVLDDYLKKYIEACASLEIIEPEYIRYLK